MSVQKKCSGCKDITGNRPTPHTLKDGHWTCGFCGHESPKRAYLTKKAKEWEAMIKAANNEEVTVEMDEETKWKKDKHGHGYTSSDGKRVIVKHPKGWISRSTTDPHDYSDVYPTQREAKAGRYAWAMKNEEAPANSVGGGKIAGMGVGAQGEPGVNLKARTRYAKKNAVEAPSPIMSPLATRKTLTDFSKGK